MSANVIMVTRMLPNPSTLPICAHRGRLSVANTTTEQAPLSRGQRRGHPHYRSPSTNAARAGHPYYRETDLQLASLAPQPRSAGHPHYRLVTLAATHPRCRIVTRDSAGPPRHRAGGKRSGRPRSLSASASRQSEGHPSHRAKGEAVQTEGRRHGRKGSNGQSSLQTSPTGVTTMSSRRGPHIRQVESSAAVHPRLRRKFSVQLPMKVALVSFEIQPRQRGNRPRMGRDRFATQAISGGSDDMGKVRHVHAVPHPSRRTGPHAHHDHVASSRRSRGRGGRPSRK